MHMDAAAPNGRSLGCPLRTLGWLVPFIRPP